MAEYIERYKLMDHIELNAREHEESYDAWQILGDVEDFPAADGVVIPEAVIRQLFYSVYALADMVNQFGYSTTFRKQDAVCDGGLSALEAAFAALDYCGCRVNSNGTISRKYLWVFMEECRRRSYDA